MLGSSLALGFEPMSPALAGRFLTTRPPGKSMKSFTISCKADMLAMNSLNLCLSGNVLISLLSRLVLLYIEFSVGSVSLLAVWLCHLTACWPPVFLMRSQLLILLRFLPLYTGSFYLADFKIFFFLSSSCSWLQVWVWIYPSWNLCNFVDVYVLFSSDLGDLQPLCFQIFLFCSFCLLWKWKLLRHIQLLATP